MCTILAYIGTNPAADFDRADSWVVRWYGHGGTAQRIAMTLRRDGWVVRIRNA